MDNIVAVGTMFESDVQCPTIHEIPLGADNVRVMVDLVMGEDIEIPIPQNGEIKTSNQMIGNFVVWPRKLVIMTKEKKVRLISTLFIIIFIFCNFSMHFWLWQPPPSTTSKSITESSKYTDVHVTIKLLNRYAMLSMQVEDMIQIKLSEHIFGKEKTIYLRRDDIMQYCGMAEIGYSCILAYIA